MLEYPAMIYRTNRNRTVVANCMSKNIIGFGKTEEDAIRNLKDSVKKISHIDINIKPVYGFLMAK